MCLCLYNKGNTALKASGTTAFSKKVKDKSTKTITCWKIYDKRDCREGETPYLSSSWMIQEIHGPGVVASGREQRSLSSAEKSDYAVRKGIHVYTRLEEAKRQKCYNCEVIVPVVCRKSDFVAEGKDNQAVFIKVEITKATWTKIFRVENKRNASLK